MVNVAKREARWRYGRKLAKAFVMDISFWRDVGKAKSETKMRVQDIKDKNAQVIDEDVKVSERFNPQEAGAYFTHLPVGQGFFSDTVNHSESVINHFAVK